VGIQRSLLARIPGVNLDLRQGIPTPVGGHVLDRNVRSFRIQPNSLSFLFSFASNRRFDFNGIFTLQEFSEKSSFHYFMCFIFFFPAYGLFAHIHSVYRQSSTLLGLFLDFSFAISAMGFQELRMDRFVSAGDYIRNFVFGIRILQFIDFCRSATAHSDS